MTEFVSHSASDLVGTAGESSRGDFVDALGRSLRDLRISVTDRCNFRCPYCMPRSVFGVEHTFLPNPELLSFSELERVIRLFVLGGVRKIRITGGEPLLRPGLADLVGRISRIDGIEDIALTTNGVLLAGQALALRAAGLRRITVSLDALDDGVFERMADSKIGCEKVLDGIAVAREAGFSPVKINMVVRRGVNESEIVPMAEKFCRPGYELRFIEYMDVGSTNGWRLADVVPSQEIFERLGGAEMLEKVEPRNPGETARRYRFRTGGGEIGLISSVSSPFCGQCTRARIAANGQLHTCLFGPGMLDLRALMRSGATDADLLEKLRGIWARRSDRYSELRARETGAGGKAEMSVLGG